MEDITQTKNDTSAKRQIVNVPGEQNEDLDDVKKHFGYENIATSARNCIKVGIQIFKQDPERFRQLLLPQ